MRKGLLIVFIGLFSTASYGQDSTDNKAHKFGTGLNMSSPFLTYEHLFSPHFSYTNGHVTASLGILSGAGPTREYTPHYIRRGSVGSRLDFRSLSRGESSGFSIYGAQAFLATPLGKGVRSVGLYFEPRVFYMRLKNKVLEEDRTYVVHSLLSYAGLALRARITNRLVFYSSVAIGMQFQFSDEPQYFSNRERSYDEPLYSPSSFDVAFNTGLEYRFSLR